MTAGLVLLVPELSLANRIVQGLAWGIVSGFTFALLAVHESALGRERAAATDIAFWQNVLAALVLLPFALAGCGALGSIGAREIALLLVLGLVCTALAHTLFIAALAGLYRAHGERDRGAGARLRHRAGAALLLGEVPGRAHARRRRADRRRGVIAATRRSHSARLARSRANRVASRLAHRSAEWMR